MSPSGGLLYHLRALRYGSELWQPFRSALAAWLATRLPWRGELILVGPSAGHCLPLVELGRFERLLVLEPDPLARLWLARRLPSVRVDVEPRDLLLGPLLSGRPGLDALLERRPSAAVLFCNVLGQLHFGLSDEQQASLERAFVTRVLPLLESRSWASFHDRWSLERGVDETQPAWLDFERYPADRELAEAWFGARGPALSLLEHATGKLFPAGLPRRYFSWQLTPTALHVVEGVGSGQPLPDSDR